MSAVAETTEFPGSSNLESASFDPETDTLKIVFRSGETYEYFNVPPSVYRGLQSATSAGSYFHRAIRQRYAYDGPQ